MKLFGKRPGTTAAAETPATEEDLMCSSSYQGTKPGDYSEAGHAHQGSRPLSERNGPDADEGVDEGADKLISFKGRHSRAEFIVIKFVTVQHLFSVIFRVFS